MRSTSPAGARRSRAASRARASPRMPTVGKRRVEVGLASGRSARARARGAAPRGGSSGSRFAKRCPRTRYALTSCVDAPGVLGVGDDARRREGVEWKRGPKERTSPVGLLRRARFGCGGLRLVLTEEEAPLLLDGKWALHPPRVQLFYVSCVDPKLFEHRGVVCGVDRRPYRNSPLTGRCSRCSSDRSGSRTLRGTALALLARRDTSHPSRNNRCDCR